MKKVAHLITEIFQSTPSHKVRMLKKFPGLKKDVSPVWLLAPLVSKLPDHLHLKIHNNATLLLDTGSKFGDEKIENNGGQHQPFLNLILACIEKHSLERKSLMEKLVEQVQQFIDDNKDKVNTIASEKMQNLIENIQLRLSLLGKCKIKPYASQKDIKLSSSPKLFSQTSPFDKSVLISSIAFYIFLRRV